MNRTVTIVCVIPADRLGDAVIELKQYTSALEILPDATPADAKRKTAKKIKKTSAANSKKKVVRVGKPGEETGREMVHRLLRGGPKKSIQIQTAFKKAGRGASSASVMLSKMFGEGAIKRSADGEYSAK